MLNRVREDLYRYSYHNPSIATNLRVILRSPGFQVTLIYRLGRWIDKVFPGNAFSPLKKVLLFVHHYLRLLMKCLHGITIDRRAAIGKGLYIGHFSGIEIGPCTIGNYCSIHQHVKIGTMLSTKRQRQPKIGSHVWIGPHSHINAVRIGNRSTISAGSTVNQDVEVGSLVVGEPARVISKHYDNRPLLGSAGQ